MGKTKAKLRAGQHALGGWIMIGHPSVAEILAGERFDWLAVDMEHTSTTVRMCHELSLADERNRCGFACAAAGARSADHKVGARQRRRRHHRPCGEHAATGQRSRRDGQVSSGGLPWCILVSRY